MLLGSAAVLISAQGVVLAQDQATAPAQADMETSEIVVTARQRNETLISVPVAVSAISGQALKDYAVTDVSDIAKLAPSLAINRNASGGAGSIALRGISTSASNAGFEQAVSVNIDGIQTSRGRILTAGLFDVEQVDVLKGPQALFFGKNSPAGVISIRTAGPTDSLRASVTASYEFVGDEPVIEGAVSGPLSPDFGARLALRYRNLDGYFRNTTGPITASPFAAGLGGQPIPAKKRPGEKEFVGRLTLAYNPAGSDFKATLKFTVDDYKSDGSTAGQQLYNCGAFPAGNIYGVLDPYGECKFDRNFQTSGLPNGVTANWPDARQQPYLNSRFYLGSLTLNYDFANLALTSVTGYLKTKTRYYGNFDATSFNVISTPEHEDYKSFTQELRLLSQFDGPVNFLIGAYYQDYRQFFQNNTLALALGPDPATGKYHTWEKPSSTDGNTYSAFGQVIWDIVDTVELAGGIRYTRETKKSLLSNSYVHAPLGGVAFSSAGRLLRDNFKGSNYSPEVTLTWRPTSDITAYGSYKTGYKSGGLGLSAVLTPATVTADAFNFEPEKIKGFEGGLKAQLLDRRLTLTSAIYSYKYTNLQVNTFNAATTSFTISNAASARVKGIEVEASFKPVRTATLYGSVAYNDASYLSYLAGCYGGQTFAQGCNVPVGPGSFAQNLSGHALARAPKWTANAGFNVDVPLNDAMKIGFTGNARYSDKFDGSENASPAGVVNSFWLLDASARIGSADDRWQLSLIGRNLTNKWYTNIVVEKPGAPTTPGTPSQTMATPQRGRQVLLQASFRY